MKKWKQLSQEERDQFKAQNPGGKASYRAQRSSAKRSNTNKLSSPLFDNTQKGSRMGTTAPANNPERAAARIAQRTDGAKYNQLSDFQQARVDRKTYKQAKQAQTRAAAETSGGNSPSAGMKQYDDTNDRYKNKVTRNQHQTKLVKREAANKGVEAPASLKQYDPSSLGNDKINKKDIRFLMSKAGGGYSAKQINKYLKNQNVEAGGLAQKMLNKRLNKVNPKAPVTDITNPGDNSEPVVNTKPQTPPAPTPEPVVTSSPEATPTPPTTPPMKVTQGDSYDKTIGTTTGDISGMNNNEGVIDFSSNDMSRDYSINIDGTAGSDLSNMASSVMYGGLNEQEYQKSQDMMSGSGRATDAIDDAEAATGASTRITDINRNVNSVPDYWNNMADSQTFLTMGDVWNMKAPNWNPVKWPKQPEFEAQGVASQYTDKKS